MAKTRLTDEGLVLTNDNGVDVMIKANHDATVDTYVKPPASDGTIGTGLGGGVATVVAGNGIAVDSTDTENPVVALTNWKAERVRSTTQSVGTSQSDVADTVLTFTAPSTGLYRIDLLVRALSADEDGILVIGAGVSFGAADAVSLGTYKALPIYGATNLVFGERGVVKASLIYSLTANDVWAVTYTNPSASVALVVQIGSTLTATKLS